MSGASQQPAAGWYPDPADETRIRYWDGTAWTGFGGPADGPTPPDPGGSRKWTPAPKTLRSITWAPLLVLAIAIVVSILNGISALAYADAIDTTLDGGELTLEEAYDAEDFFAITGFVYLVAVIGGAVGFIAWFRRGYRNVEALGIRPLRYGTGWSIGSWFVPILNLFRPKQIANDIWRSGDPAAAGNPGWSSLPVSSLVHWWWAVWILLTVLGGAASAAINVDPVLSDAALAPGLSPGARDELETEHVAAILYAVSALVEIASAVLAIAFVTRTSDRQDQRIAEAGARPSED